MKSMGLGACLAACLVGPAQVSFAQARPAEVADTLNEDGKSLYKSQNYPEAAKKFHQAIELSPEARFYFNLCATLEKLQDYNGALEACDSVYAHEPADELKAKTGARAASIRAAQKKRAEDQATSPVTTPVSTTTGTQLGPSQDSPTPPAQTGEMGQPALPPAQAPLGYHSVSPQPGVHIALDPLFDYRWSVGVEAGFMTSSIGKTEDQFADGGGTFKLQTSYYVWPEAKLGVQGYLDISVSRAVDVAVVGKAEQLSIVDLGGALYYHHKLSSNLYVTPLAGLHISGLQPYQGQDDPMTFGTFGIKGEAAFSLVLGDGRHILSVTPMLNYYFPASDTEEGSAHEFGFDKGGIMMALTFGYTHRFKQGLSGPLIILE